MSGGGGSTQTTQTKQTIPDEFKPLATGLANYAGQVAGRPYYPGPTIAGFSPEQEAGLTGTAYRGAMGSPVNQAAQGNITDTLQGKYLGANPYLDAMIQRTNNDVMTRFGGMLGHNAGYQNSGAQEVLGRTLADSANALQYQNYGAERNNQLQAAGMAPALASTDYQDLQALLGAGDVRRQYAQDVLNEGQKMYNYPVQQLGVLQSALGSAQGGGMTQVGPNPYQTNPAANALGGGLLGYGAAQALGMSNPWLGAGLGAAGMLLGSR